MQVTDVLRYTIRMVTVTDHPGSETIQELLEEERCARGKENFSQPGIKCLSHHEAYEQLLSTDAPCNSCRGLSQVSVSQTKAFKDCNSTDTANSKVYGSMQTGKFKFWCHT